MSGPRADPSSNFWRRAVGGRWDEIGRLQVDFLVSHGLQSRHTFLDVGCGSLRAGVHLIAYLDEGKYHGIEVQQWLLDAGVQHELPSYGLQNRRIQLLCNGDFDFESFGTSFDYAIAHSLFTHLPPTKILRCLENLGTVLAPDGTFYATFFEDPDGSHTAAPVTHAPTNVVTFPDRDPFHYAFEAFVEFGRRTRLDVTYLGDWGHPHGQKMMRFTVRRER